MPRIRCSAALLIGLGLVGCAVAPPEGAVEGRVGEPFELAVGEVGVVTEAGLVVRFLAVTEDSRCPIDAICIWAGNGTAALRLSAPGPARLVALNTGLPPRAERIGDFDLGLHDLLPAPRIDVTRDPAAYRVSLLVTRR